MVEQENTEQTFADGADGGDDGIDVQGATLLLVDDEPNIVSSLRRLFRPLGYKILTAGNGEEGLAVMQENSVDLIISDMRMPVMDGAAFLSQAAECWPDTVRILLTGYADMESTVAAINKGKIYSYISKPWEDSDITLGVRHALQQRFLERERRRLLVLTKKQNSELQDLNANLEDKVKERTEKLRQAVGLLEKSYESIKKNYVDTVRVFSNIIEMREGVVSGHSRRVAEHAYALAIKCGMSKEEAQQVLYAGLLHDIGKIGLPDKLITKPFNALINVERAEVMKHPMVGEGLLMGLENLTEASRLIRSHKERYDGQGYPDGLKGKEIPTGARILSLINDFFSLQAGTLSTQRLSPGEAQEYISRNQGKRYDPALVKVWLEMYDSLQEGVDDVSRGREMSSRDLVKGMVLARDLKIKNNVLLLSKGHILDDHIIRRIKKMEDSIGEILEIHIE